MYRAVRRVWTVGLITLVTWLATLVTPQIAGAAESVPELQWPPASAGRYVSSGITSPSGSVTLPCTINGSNDSNLTTYSVTGQLVQSISHTDVIDDVTNCITQPVVDKNGTVYGVPYGKDAYGSWAYGPNLLAYNGNTLKWKYPIGCGSNRNKQWVVGANGNIYALSWQSDGAHLVGIAPELQPGQTQPNKVLDLKVASTCSIELSPYRDGLMVHGQSSGDAKFYSYSGKFLTQTQGDYWTEKLSAAGELFYPSYVTGSFKSVNINKYDPRTGKVVWTTPASTTGANVQNSFVHPLPGGGVAVLVYEQKMNSGMPATPTEYIYTLVTLNSAGQKVGTAATLPNKDTQGNEYDFPFVSVDSSGKIAVVRNAYVPTGINYPATMPAIAIGVYNTATSSWTYQKLMSGDPAKPGGPTGYYLDAGPILASNTLYLVAHCSGNCDTSRKVYAVKMPGLGIDYPRGEVISANTPVQPAPVSFVLMGDSYSSGQGAGDYDEGTVTATNKCYKSWDSYGRILHRNPNSAFSLDKFAACGGAVTSDVYQSGTYAGVPPQNSTLSSSTQAVAVSIGGNDIGFANVIETCADPTKDCNGAFSLANSKLGILDVNLQKVYLDILNKTSSANVYVIGYPPIVVSGSGCYVGNNGKDFPFFTESRKQKAVELQNSVNTTIKKSVSTIRSTKTEYQRLRFVDAAINSSPFTGHDVCSSNPYVNGLKPLIGETPESFHPNKKGQGAYADLLRQNS